MAFALTERDHRRLAGVHPDLVRVVHRAAALPDCPRFMVVQGLRTLEEQRRNVASGASWTMDSRHLTGHAVDLAPYLDTDGDGDSEASWHWPHYYPLAKVIKRAAELEGVALDWGGDWRRRKDGPHWELNRKAYPA